MAVQPLYREGQEAAYQLRYSWCGWPHGSRRWRGLPDEAILETVKPLWEQDRLRLPENTWSAERIQFTFSARPNVSPVFLAARAKGRLQYALRKASAAFEGFSRKVSVRSLGDNTREQVQRYIASQVKKAGFVDPRFRKALEEFTVVCPEVDLSVPDTSARGRYW